MSDRLTIRTFGGLSVELDGTPVSSFNQKKVPALLVYLACTGRSHPREPVAELFWEGRTQSASLRNLGVALTNLRKTVGAFVLTDDALAMNPDSDWWLDAAAFEKMLSEADEQQITAAVELYKGNFLDGFSVDSAAFEEWTTRERERLRLRMQSALDALIALHLERGEHDAGITRANQLLALDNLREKSHRQLMLLLHNAGEREAALAQYDTLSRLLEAELQVEPTAESKTLVERLRAGEEMVTELATTTTSPREITNPYKGLRAFQEADAVDFFGRETLTQHLLDRLTEEVSFARFLAVVGPSGCGKSSVIKAGLIPAIRRGALPGSSDWQVVEIVPGSHPFEELEIALTRLAANPPTDLMTQLKRDKRGILRAVRMVLPEEESQLLLVIDQFEEVFTLVSEAATTRHLLDSLYAAVTAPRTPLRVVITLRGDFFDRPLMYPPFGEMVCHRTEAIMPMTTEELEQAVTCPAARVGVSLETGLATTIVSEVVERPGSLPMLQYALTELFGPTGQRHPDPGHLPGHRRHAGRANPADRCGLCQVHTITAGSRSPGLPAAGHVGRRHGGHPPAHAQERTAFGRRGSHPDRT